MSALEIRTTRDVDLFTGKELVRFRVRRRGERLWTKFVVTCDSMVEADRVDENREQVAQSYLDETAAS